MMSESRAFSDVTVEMVTLIKRVADAQHGVRFDPVEGSDGTATGRTPFGDCVVHFVHDDARSVLVLTLLKKPMLLPASFLWSGFKGEIERCRKLVRSQHNEILSPSTTLRTVSEGPRETTSMSTPVRKTA